MKVLMTTDAVGGVWTYALDLCAALGGHDVEVVLAVLGPAPAASRRRAAARLRNVRLHVHPCRLEWMPDATSDVESSGEWLLSLAAAEGVDLVHLGGYAHAALPWGRPVVVVAHSCVCTWWRAVHGTEAPAEWSAYRARVARGLAAATRVVAPTQAFLADFRQAHRCDVPASVIPNGRDPRAVRGDPLGERLPAVLGCGRLWDEAKAMASLDRVAEWLPWPTYLAGDPVAPDGRRFAARGAHLLGPLQAGVLAGWLGRAAIYAHPAVYEPFGLAPLEAALGGCALVLGDLPSLREVWGDAAVYVPPRDADALRAALCDLIASPERRRDLALAARRRVARYAPAPMAAAYHDTYAALLGGAGRRAVA